MKRERIKIPTDKEVAEAFNGLMHPAETLLTNDVELGYFEAGLIINEYDLNNVVSKQPSESEKVSDRYALAKSVRDQAKDDLETVEAETLLKLKADGVKGTAPEIAAMVQVNPWRKKAFKRYLEADRFANKLNGLVKSYEGRGFMISEMCKLYISKLAQDGSVRGPANDMQNREYEANRARLAEERKRRDKGGK